MDYLFTSVVSALFYMLTSPFFWISLLIFSVVRYLLLRHKSKHNNTSQTVAPNIADSKLTSFGIQATTNDVILLDVDHQNDPGNNNPTVEVQDSNLSESSVQDKPAPIENSNADVTSSVLSQLTQENEQTSNHDYKRNDLIIQDISENHVTLHESSNPVDDKYANMTAQDISYIDLVHISNPGIGNIKSFKKNKNSKCTMEVFVSISRNNSYSAERCFFNTDALGKYIFIKDDKDHTSKLRERIESLLSCPKNVLADKPSTNNITVSVDEMSALKSDCISQYSLSLFKSYDSIVIFDTETSGLNPSTDQIVELAAVQLQMESGKLLISNIVNTFIKLYNGHTIPPKVSQINHITNQMANTQGISPLDASHKFIALLHNTKSLLVAHNAQFDLSFLLKLFSDLNLNNSINSADVLDTLTVFKDRHSYPHKLSDAILAYHLQELVSNSHRAIDDALALTRVLISMDKESNDLTNYVNLFGFNPKYPIPSYSKLSAIKYLPQPYNMTCKLYQLSSTPQLRQSPPASSSVSNHLFDNTPIMPPLILNAKSPDDLEIMGDQLDDLRLNYAKQHYHNSDSSPDYSESSDEMDEYGSGEPDIPDPDSCFEPPIEDYPPDFEEIDERMDDNFYIGDGDDNGDDYY